MIYEKTFNIKFPHEETKAKGSTYILSSDHEPTEVEICCTFDVHLIFAHCMRILHCCVRRPSAGVFSQLQISDVIRW